MGLSWKPRLAFEAYGQLLLNTVRQEMNPHSKMITRLGLYSKYAAMLPDLSHVLILLRAPSHARTTAFNLTIAPTAINDIGELTDTNLSAGHLQSFGTGEGTMRKKRRASSLSSDTPYPVWTLCRGGTSWA